LVYGEFDQGVKKNGAGFAINFGGSNGFIANDHFTV
jgi:hypothetical protein